MIDIGIVRKSSIGKGYRSEKDAILLDVEMSDPRDIQSVEYLFAQGNCAIPVVGDTVLIHEVWPEYKVATASNFGVVTAIKEGERSVFAVKDGEVAAVIDFLSSGELVLNQGEDYAVMYGGLQSEFDELKGKYNSLVNVLLAWIPVAQDGGAKLSADLEAANIASPLESSADITKSKVEKIRI